jgi:drug/metabolite transporter superfamily protein YnfA
MEGFVRFIPFLLVTLTFGCFAYFLCLRKGKNRGYALLCLIPLVQFFVFFWLISLADKSVLERLASLERSSTFT